MGSFYEEHIVPRLEHLREMSVLASGLGYTKQSAVSSDNPDGSCTITLSCRKPTPDELIWFGDD